MSKLLNSMLGLWVIGMGLAMSAPAQAASGVGPYYATPSWDQTFPASTRFIVLTNMNSEAVLDRETGLVWEQSPDQNEHSWFAAQVQCSTKTVGTRKGWRLPNMQELLSLVDRSLPPSSPTLPAGHPFSNVRLGFTDVYWSATSNQLSVTPAAWAESFGSGNTLILSKSNALFTWCVRGGQGPDVL
jgi:hypothetical protein